jgi:hypothetical protein
VAAIPDRNNRFRLRPRCHTNTDPKVSDLRLPFPLIIAQQMNCFASNCSRNPMPPIHPDQLANWYDAVVSTDGTEIEQALLVDMMHDEADLIHMSSKYNFHPRSTINRCSHVTMYVCCDVIGVRLSIARCKCAAGCSDPLGEEASIKALRNSTD